MKHGTNAQRNVILQITVGVIAFKHDVRVGIKSRDTMAMP